MKAFKILKEEEIKNIIKEILESREGRGKVLKFIELFAERKVPIDPQPPVDKLINFFDINKLNSIDVKKLSLDGKAEVYLILYGIILESQIDKEFINRDSDFLEKVIMEFFKRIDNKLGDYLQEIKKALQENEKHTTISLDEKHRISKNKLYEVLQEFIKAPYNFYHNGQLQLYRFESIRSIHLTPEERIKLEYIINTFYRSKLYSFMSEKILLEPVVRETLREPILQEYLDYAYYQVWIQNLFTGKLEKFISELQEEENFEKIVDLINLHYPKLLEDHPYLIEYLKDTLESEAPITIYKPRLKITPEIIKLAEFIENADHKTFYRLVNYYLYKNKKDEKKFREKIHRKIADALNKTYEDEATEALKLKYKEQFKNILKRSAKLRNPKRKDYSKIKKYTYSLILKTLLLPDSGDYDSSSNGKNDKMQSIKNTIGQVAMTYQLGQMTGKKMKKFLLQLTTKFQELNKILNDLKGMLDFIDSATLYSLSEGIWQRNINYRKILELYELIKNKPEIKKLAEILGRIHSQEKEEYTKTVTEIKFKNIISNYGRSEIRGVIPSNKIPLMLPMEAALLSNPKTKKLFLLKYIENRLLTFEYVDRLNIKYTETKRIRFLKPTEKKGPIIILVDTSGSMTGEREMIAKALCFAVASIANKQKRYCFLISFSSTNDIETLDLSEIFNSLDSFAKLIEFLSFSFNGGTDITGALIHANKMLKSEKYKNADVLAVSDFETPSIDENLIKQHTKTKFHAVIVNSKYYAKDVVDLFHYQWKINENFDLKLYKELEKTLK